MRQMAGTHFTCVTCSQKAMLSVRCFVFIVALAKSDSEILCTKVRHGQILLSLTSLVELA